MRLALLLVLLLASPGWAQERVVVNGVSCEVTRPAKHDTRVECDNGGTDGLRDILDASGKMKREKLKKVRDPRKLWLGKSWKAETVPEVFPPERDPVPVSESDVSPSPVAADVALDAAITIDTNIVWSQAAQNALGGAANAQATAVLATALTNEGYANSGSPNIRFRLVGTGLVNYVEGQGLGWMSSSPQVQALRTATGADLVGMITTDNECGIGNLGGYYSISHVNCVTANLTYPHEAGGHNLRMHHQPLTGGAPACDTTPAYNCGHQSADNAVRDMLAYGGGRQRLYSNPAVPFFGRTEPSGTTHRNNARVLREQAARVAAFRSSVIPPPLPPPPPPDWVADAIHVTDDATAATLRTSLIQQVWGCDGFPARQADAITLNVDPATMQSPIPLVNIARVDRYTVKTYGQTVQPWLITPTVSSSRLSVVILGHSDTLASGVTLSALVDEALRRGHAVLVVPMPLGGVPAHDGLSTQASSVFTPMVYFLDPAIIALNTYVATNSPTSITMMGVSGGGWTTVLLAALDPRVRQSVEIAGTLPLLLRDPAPAAEFGDFEQRWPSLLINGDPLDYLDLYLMGASDGRTQLQIHNKLDTCCFGGMKEDQYASQVTAQNSRWSFIRVVEAGIHGITAASVTSLVGPLLGPVLVTPPPTYTQIIDDEDAGYATVGAWKEWNVNRPTSYNGDDWAPLVVAPASCSSGGGTGDRQATWTFTGVPDFPVNVRVSYVIDANRATNVPYEIRDGTGAVLWAGLVNQKVNNGIVIGAAKFALLSTVQTATGTIVVWMSNNANACVNDDAARVSTN